MSYESDLKEALDVPLPTVVPKIPEEEPEQFEVYLTIKPSGIGNHQSNESNQNVNMTPTIQSLSTI